MDEDMEWDTGGLSVTGGTHQAIKEAEVTQRQEVERKT